MKQNTYSFYNYHNCKIKSFIIKYSVLILLAQLFSLSNSFGQCINSLPYEESFENGLGVWDNIGYYDWFVSYQSETAYDGTDVLSTGTGASGGRVIEACIGDNFTDIQFSMRYKYSNGAGASLGVSFTDDNGLVTSSGVTVTNNDWLELSIDLSSFNIVGELLITISGEVISNPSRGVQIDYIQIDGIQTEDIVIDYLNLPTIGIPGDQTNFNIQFYAIDVPVSNIYDRFEIQYGLSTNYDPHNLNIVTIDSIFSYTYDLNLFNGEAVLENISFSYPNSLSSGNYYFFLEFDTDDDVTENNETNNFFSVPFILNEATCNDGVLNQDEEQIDCGGVCMACATCTDGIRNGDEYDIDCGGSDCDSCATIIYGSFFETGFEGWQDGGSDCNWYESTVYSYEGSHSIELRDNSGSNSSMSSPFFDLRPYNEVGFYFHYYPNSMETGEDFFIEMYNGTAWDTIGQYISGIDFSNGTFYSDSIIITSGFTEFNQFKITCDASTDSDQIFIDAITIKWLSLSHCNDGIKNEDEEEVDCGGMGCAPCSTCSDGIQNGDEKGIDCGGSDCNPCNNIQDTTYGFYFESGLDGWTEGGSDCQRIASSYYAYEGNYSIQIRDDNGISSSMISPILNLSEYSQVTFSFHYYPFSMENGENFFVEFYDGNSWSTIADYSSGAEFTNSSFHFDSLIINNGFSTNNYFRITCDASTNSDQIFIDAVVIHCFISCSDGIQNGNEEGIDCGGTYCDLCPTCTDGIQNGDEEGIDCGGTTCDPCPTCYDGIQNGDEEGVDCGGSCPQSCLPLEITGDPNILYLDCGNPDFECEFDTWVESGGGTTAINGCSSSYDWDSNKELSDLMCGENNIFLKVTDACGNEDSIASKVFIHATESLNILASAQDLTVDIADTNFLQIIKDWVADNGGMEFENLCSGIASSFYSQPQSEMVCGDYFYTFEVRDNCGSSYSETVELTVLDSDPPVVSSQPNDIVIISPLDYEAKINAWLSAYAGAIVNDNSNYEVDASNDFTDDLNFSSGFVKPVEFTFSDNCNSAAAMANIIYEPCAVSLEGTNLELECSCYNQNFYEEVIEEWLTSGANVEITSSCQEYVQEIIYSGFDIDLFEECGDQSILFTIIFETGDSISYTKEILFDESCCDQFAVYVEPELTNCENNAVEVLAHTTLDYKLVNYTWEKYVNDAWVELPDTSANLVVENLLDTTYVRVIAEYGTQCSISSISLELVPENIFPQNTFDGTIVPIDSIICEGDTTQLYIAFNGPILAGDYYWYKVLPDSSRILIDSGLVANIGSISDNIFYEVEFNSPTYCDTLLSYNIDFYKPEPSTIYDSLLACAGNSIEFNIANYDSTFTYTLEKWDGSNWIVDGGIVDDTITTGVITDTEKFRINAVNGNGCETFSEEIFIDTLIPGLLDLLIDTAGFGITFGKLTYNGDTLDNYIVNWYDSDNDSLLFQSASGIYYDSTVYFTHPPVSYIPLSQGNYYAKISKASLGNLTCSQFNTTVSSIECGMLETSFSYKGPGGPKAGRSFTIEIPDSTESLSFNFNAEVIRDTVEGWYNGVRIFQISGQGDKTYSENISFIPNQNLVEFKIYNRNQSIVETVWEFNYVNCCEQPIICPTIDDVPQFTDITDIYLDEYCRLWATIVEPQGSFQSGCDDCSVNKTLNKFLGFICSANNLIDTSFTENPNNCQLTVSSFQNNSYSIVSSCPSNEFLDKLYYFYQNYKNSPDTSIRFVLNGIGDNTTNSETIEIFPSSTMMDKENDSLHITIVDPMFSGDCDQCEGFKSLIYENFVLNNHAGIYSYGEEITIRKIDKSYRPDDVYSMSFSNINCDGCPIISRTIDIVYDIDCDEDNWYAYANLMAIDSGSIDSILCMSQSLVEDEYILSRMSDANSILYSLQPNPALDYIQIKTVEPRNKIIDYEVYDYTGRIYQRSQIDFIQTNESPPIDVGNLHPGFYLIILRDGEDSTVLRFVKT